MTGPRLRVAVLAKQVPVAEALRLGPDGRLVRSASDLEMNPYCRRAVAKGAELAAATGGTCVVFTLGPEAAEDVLREAVAWGADAGVHLCDAAFAGSDTLATARALAAAVRSAGPFDLVLVGRNSVDGDTGQVGPELAELLGLAFAGGVRGLELADGRLRLRLEHDDGWEQVEVQLPAVLSVAERLCDPCKVDREGRAGVAANRLRRLAAVDLGPGPWGDAGSPTSVGAVRALDHGRARHVLHGPVDAQVAEAVRRLHERGALAPGAGAARTEARPDPPATGAATGVGEGPWVAVVVEGDRPAVTAELLGAAADLAGAVGGRVVALVSGDTEPQVLGALGAALVVRFSGARAADDVAVGLVGWAREAVPWVVLAPSTDYGREVAGRAAAALGAGLVGDAVAVDVREGRLVALKPALAGALVAEITCSSAVQMATVRPGVLPVPSPHPGPLLVEDWPVSACGRVRVLDRGRDDDVEVLARAEAVIGVGTGVDPSDYERLAPLAAVLGAELAATRKVTDRGWAPRSRQVGITGRSISPRLYVGVGLSGKFNHMIGVRAAGTVVVVNSDPEAPAFAHCDIGIVADWRQAVPALVDALRRGPDPGPAPPSGWSAASRDP